MLWCQWGILPKGLFILSFYCTEEKERPCYSLGNRGVERRVSKRHLKIYFKCKFSYYPSIKGSQNFFKLLATTPQVTFAAGVIKPSRSWGAGSGWIFSQGYSACQEQGWTILAMLRALEKHRATPGMHGRRERQNICELHHHKEGSQESRTPDNTQQIPDPTHKRRNTESQR